jgi:hypothetical protein
MHSTAFTGKSLGILLTVHPNDPNFAKGISLAQKALNHKLEVYLYCLGEAVFGVSDTNLQSLRSQGLRLFACAYGARKLGVPCKDQAIFCGLSVLSDILSGTDQCASF